jgi:hypothetical protein
MVIKKIKNQIIQISQSEGSGGSVQNIRIKKFRIIEFQMCLLLLLFKYKIEFN